MQYRYEGLAKITLMNNKSNKKGEIYYSNNVYPDIPLREDDAYVITVLGDRLDLLAFDFYGDSTYWWIIASANALPGDSMIPPIGSQLRIPTNIRSAINQYKIANINR